MIVPAPIAHPLTRGTATHLRLPAHGDTCPHHPGQSIPIRPAGGHTIGRIIIITATHQLLGDATTDQLRDEGWGGRNPRLAFAKAWLHRHDAGYRTALPHATDDEIIARLHERHAQRPTWRIAVTPDPDQPRRLLAARSELGYTTSPHLALPDEPEAVDEASQEAITRAAQQRAADRADDDRDTHRALLADRIQRASRHIADARERADISPHVAEALRRSAESLRRAERELASLDRIR